MSFMNFPTDANEMCFHCINGAGGCSWSNRLQPVKGSKYRKGRVEGSIKIIFCPEFEEGDRLWSKRKAQEQRNAQKS